MDEAEKRLRAEVRNRLKQAEATDKEEDMRYGRDRRGDKLPEELQRRETRIARIQEAKRALEEAAREQAKSDGKDPEEAQPTAKSQCNVTDPESRILKGADGFVKGYNAQIAVGPVFQLTVRQRVTQAVPKERAELSRWRGSYRPRQGQPSMRHGNPLSSQYSDRSNRLADSDSLSYAD